MDIVIMYLGKNTFLSFLLNKNKSKFNQDERKIIDFGSNGGFVLLLCGGILYY